MTTSPLVGALLRAPLILLLVLPAGACGPLVESGLLPDVSLVEPCSPVLDLLSVGGEASNIDGAVTLVVREADGRVNVEVTPADDSLVHTASFPLAGAELDAVTGAVTAEAGVVFAGEGSEYGYLRLTDERGVWFEGGESKFIDGVAQGGAALDGPFGLGVATGEGCRRTSDGADVKRHSVLASLADSSEDVVVDAAGTPGVWRGVDVRVVGVSAERVAYTEASNAVDGLGPGTHDISNVDGYLYRVRLDSGERLR